MIYNLVVYPSETSTFPSRCQWHVTTPTPHITRTFGWLDSLYISGACNMLRSIT